jgi:hypothetical protein
LGSAVLRFHSPGESPPPAPKARFGRGDLVEKVIGLAENLESIALIGARGIGKTSIALTILHHNRIKEPENRRFIRCDQFPASRSHFLARISEVVGAGVESPKDMTPLRPFLSSKQVFIVLENAESIPDPKGTYAKEIYSVVDELCQFETICLCITSRITMVPRTANVWRYPHCRWRRHARSSTVSTETAGSLASPTTFSGIPYITVREDWRMLLLVVTS